MSGHDSGSERSCTPRSDVDLNNKSLSKSPSMSPKHVSRSRTGSPADRPRNRSYSRSRSTSRSPRRYRDRYSYSRSRSYSPRRYKYDKRRRGYRHSRSRSPVPSRRRHNGSRMTSYKTNSRMGRGNTKMSIDNPDPSRVLGVFGLSLYTTERELHHIFSKFGPIEKVMVVLDAQSGRSRGFAFVYFESTSDAKMAKEECTGMEIDGRRIRVDYSVTQRPHTPTPGIYMGKPTESRSGYHRGGYRRSPSPRYRSRRRYDRSRSRSYSPRRKGWGQQTERSMTRNSML